MLKAYYTLTKPGIIYGNAITLAAGFFLASRGHANLLLLLTAFVGLSLVIASACVFNNIHDVGMDAKMERTKDRELVRGVISKKSAVVYASILGALGFAILLLYTNPLTTLVAFVGFFTYVALYTPLKPKTAYAALVGSISGATPPVVGYTAATERFDMAALLLFLFLVVWQMPHFYAIAIRRMEDYRSASVPVLPLARSVKAAKVHILSYIAAFALVTTLFTVFKFTGYIHLTMSLLLSLIWFFMGIKGFKTEADKMWAKKMFLFSLIVLTATSALIALGK